MIQAKYNFINDIGTLPKLVTAALQYVGIKEYPGTKSNNPVIMDMAKNLGVSNIYKDDETSWCALFICYLCLITGKPQPFKDYEILRAKSFVDWGSEVDFEDMQLGDIVVFQRPGGNHVGILIAVTKDSQGTIQALHVLGGNQSNSVTIAEISKARLIAVRRHYATAAPASAQQYNINSSGQLSSNEA